MLVRVGVISMYVALVFTLAAAALILVLRGEPRLALAMERASQITEERPDRPAQILPERPVAMPKPEPTPLPPEPSKPVSEPEPNESLEPEAKPGPEQRRKPVAKPKPAKVAPVKTVAKPEPKPERDLRPERPPDPKPAPETVKEPRRETKDRPEQGPEPALTVRPAKRGGAAEERPAAGASPRPDLPAGTVMTISASALGLHDAPVASSASERALDGGVIHLPDTSLPWDGGEGGRNVYLAGHRLGWPGTGSHRVFYRLDELRRGDWIVLKDAHGRKYRYRVTGSSVVLPGDAWVKDPVPGRDMLTLQTCTPIPSFEKRLIVRANRV